MTWVFLMAIPWAFILWLIIEKTFSTDSSFWLKIVSILSILIWSGLGVLGYTILSFMFFGRERILINRDQMLIEKPLVFYNRRSYYFLQQISQLRVGREQYKARENGIWVIRERSILIMEYPDKQVTFGRGTSPEEAEWILLKIAQSGFLPTTSFAPTHHI
ncbi:MAG TPA: hypothetical protein VLZ75_03405 [Chitinophagales bacterium]|nr:hypothetical protein [Chitinophagales bacterium]